MLRKVTVLLVVFCALCASLWGAILLTELASIMSAPDVKHRDPLEQTYQAPFDAAPSPPGHFGESDGSP